jgi:hypothetical protein
MIHILKIVRGYLNMILRSSELIQFNMTEERKHMTEERKQVWIGGMKEKK